MAEFGVSVVSATAPTQDEPGETGLQWLQRFERERGRPLRVLHLGNIANNAYNNAKIQRQRGIEADVACWSYYHVMGCPEWEDADFDGDFGDPFFPDWWGVDLRGFERPRWFVQGRRVDCQRYLAAKNGGQRIAAALHWRLPGFGRWRDCRASRPARFLRWLREGLRAARASVRQLRARLVRAVAWTVWGIVRLIWRGAPLIPSSLRRPAWRWLVGIRRGLVRTRRCMLRHRLSRPAHAPTAAQLISRFKLLFPDRAPLTKDDYESSRGALTWMKLLNAYDVVQAYATHTEIPLLCGFRPYTGYEHGTLRELPFADNSVGRLCALGYRGAAGVFVTNLDVLPSVARLGIDEARVVRLPHAVDGTRLREFADQHFHLKPSADEVTFISPSRQDWVDGDLSLSKGNDRMIRALALVRAQGLRFRALMAGWGRDLGASTRLVRELELDDVVSWLPPMRKRRLWESYLQHHAMLDQFAVPGISGVTFEALALGRRVITMLDVAVAERFFGAAPPLMACGEPETIADAIVAVIRDPLDQAGIGSQAREWFERFHSADRIVELQAQTYRRVLDG